MQQTENKIEEGQLLISAGTKIIKSCWGKIKIENSSEQVFVRSNLGLWWSHKVVCESVISSDEHILQQSTESPHSSPSMASLVN